MSTLSLIHSILTQILVLLGVLSPVTDLANVAYEAGDGTTLHAYLATPETGCASGCPAAIVFHAWNGLSEEPLYFADQLAEQGYVALAPDLFRGSANAPAALLPWNIFTTIATPQERMDADVDAAISYLLARDDLAVVRRALSCSAGSNMD